jgi:hypothetical protein
VLTGRTAATYNVWQAVRNSRTSKEEINMEQNVSTALIFLGLVILAIVNFLGFRQVAKALQEKKG